MTVSIPPPTNYDSTDYIDERQCIGDIDSVDAETTGSEKTLLGNSGEYFRDSADRVSGVISQLPPRTAKYLLQAAARELMPDHRVAKCHRVPAHKASRIEIRKGSDGRARFGGLQTCGSIWDCAVCQSKIQEFHARNMNKAAKQHLQQGDMLHAVFTLSHTRRETLKQVLATLRQSMNDAKGRYDWRAARKKFGIRADATTLENNYGRNGWHPHLHMIIFCDWISPEGVNDLGQIYSNAWEESVRGNGGSLISSRGFKIQGGDYATDYVAKWGAIRELTNAAGKKGRRGGRTAAQLLAAYAIAGDKAAGKLWQEYSETLWRKNFLTWSHGAHAEFGIPKMTDKDIAAGDDGFTFDVWAEIDLLTWRCVVMARRDLRIELLNACEADDYAQFQRLLAAAVEHDRKRNSQGNDL